MESIPKVEPCKIKVTGCRSRSRSSSESEDEETDEENMPKKQTRKERRNKQDILLQASADISLNAFADCAIPASKGRVRKSVIGAAVSQELAGPPKPKVVEPENASKVEEEEAEELNWLEKDLEDFELEIKPTQEEEVDLAFPIASPSKKGKKKKIPVDDKSGVVYPIDLWYILSDYIDPEDVGRFAGLCQGTRSITRLTAFWRNLYYRYYNAESQKATSLPVHLTPSSMEKVHGLRARVIQALYYLYPPLAGRLQGKAPMEDEPHQLKGQRCLLAWHQPGTLKGWQFYFKFQKPSFQSLSSRPARREDVYEGYNDLMYNPEEGCSVLQVTVDHFSSVEPVMGLLLNQVYVTLCLGFRRHRLRLHFDTLPSTSNKATSDEVLVLDDVAAIKVIKWWHPNYPFIS